MDSNYPILEYIGCSQQSVHDIIMWIFNITSVVSSCILLFAHCYYVMNVRDPEINRQQIEFNLDGLAVDNGQNENTQTI